MYSFTIFMLFWDTNILSKFSPLFQDLNDLLQNRSGLNDKLVLSCFKGKKELTEDMRDKLADIILNELLKDDYYRK